MHDDTKTGPVTPSVKSSALRVNGTVHEVSAQAETPLLWILRDLGLASVRYGCGLGQCGACTVLIDGMATAACQVPLRAATDVAITTHEGLAGDPAYERVVEALVSWNAGQCGYCLSGITLTLVSLVRRPQQVGRDELVSRLDGHLCRCGAHPRILRAALEALGDDHANR